LEIKGRRSGEKREPDLIWDSLKNKRGVECWRELWLNRYREMSNQQVLTFSYEAYGEDDGEELGPGAVDVTLDPRKKRKMD